MNKDFKECDECHEIKSMDSFPACPQRLDGKKAKCRVCIKIKEDIRLAKKKADREFLRLAMPI